MLKAHTGFWFDDTCNSTCLLVAGIPKAVPGETDRHINIQVNYPYSKNTINLYKTLFFYWKSYDEAYYLTILLAGYY